MRALFADGQNSIAEGSPADIRRAVERYVEESLADDLAGVWSHYMEPLGSHLWVAEADGDIIGMTGIQPAGPGVGEVRRMAVARRARRRGLARCLLYTAETWASAHGYVAMEATTTHLQAAALALYESVGYRVCGAGAWGPLRLVHLRRRLGGTTRAGARGKA